LMSQNAPNQNTKSEILLAGAFAAFTIDILVYPLDTLKTRLQSKDYKRLFVNASTNTVNRAALFRGSYQGIGSVILATLPSSGAFFLTYESMKTLLTPLSSLPSPIVHSAASSIAELVSCAILTPSEVIKQNAQMVSSGGTGATMATIRRFRSHPSSLFRGYTALVMRNLPFTALQFPMFEAARERIWRFRKVTPEEASLTERAVVTAISAGGAGGIAAVMTTPVDVVKTRVMLSAASETKSQLGEWAVFKSILKEEGVKGLWRGGALRGIWTIVGSGLYLGVYDLGRVYLGRRRGIEVQDID